MTDLTAPLYADKPQRRIPGTTAVAVTMYRSHDGTVRRIAVIDAADGAHLGTVHYQHRKTMTRQRGYALVPCPMGGDEVWPNLAVYVVAMRARLGLA